MLYIITGEEMSGKTVLAEAMQNGFSARNIEYDIHDEVNDLNKFLLAVRGLKNVIITTNLPQYFMINSFPDTSNIIFIEMTRPNI